MKVAHPEYQRDMDLIRLLLMRASGYDVSADLAPYTDKQRALHTALLKDAGYVDAVISPAEEGFPTPNLQSTS